MTPGSFHISFSPRAVAYACGLALLLCTTLARADDLKLGGIWLPDVQIVAMRDGKLTYQTAAGATLDKPLAEIEDVRFTDTPQYHDAIDALAAGDTKTALPLLDKAAAARAPWVKAYAAAAKWRALAQAGDIKSAVRSYLDLAATGADPFFLADPPLAAVAAASPAHRTDIAAMLRAALPRAADNVKPLLQSMLDAIPPDAPPQAVEAPKPQSPDAAPPPEEVAPADSAVVLPVKIEESAATKLLRAGKFDDALRQIAVDIEQPGSLAVDLYLQGIAYLYRADAAGDLDGYRDAGLAFMRVIVYFPRSDFAGRNLVGGSLLELAYIHDKLGRAEKATELYDRAAAELDETADPNLHQRLTTLRDARP